MEFSNREITASDEAWTSSMSAGFFKSFLFRNQDICLDKAKYTACLLTLID